jgi:hypothetical protein
MHRKVLRFCSSYSKLSCTEGSGAPLPPAARRPACTRCQAPSLAGVLVRALSRLLRWQFPAGTVTRPVARGCLHYLGPSRAMRNAYMWWSAKDVCWMHPALYINHICRKLDKNSNHLACLREMWCCDCNCVRGAWSV